MRIIVVEPKVPSRGYASPYREQKIAAHTTRKGKGRVARALAKKSALVLLPLLLFGCGALNVHIQRAEFSIMYADIKAQISVWMFRIEQGCTQGKLSADTCSELPRVRDGLNLLDEQAKMMLRRADKDVDWATIGKYVEIAVKLAAKAAL